MGTSRAVLVIALALLGVGGVAQAGGPPADTDTGCGSMLDLILILDFSINPVAPKATDLDVRTVKAFATALLEHLDIGEDKTRVGVVVYGQEATTVLHLTGSLDTIQNSISTAALAGKVKWGNSMGLAVVEAVWGLVNDSRPLDTTGRTAVVVNVHPTTDSPKQHRAAVELASANNITLITVGIGSLADSEALRLITQNDSSRVFLAANTSAALGLIEDLVEALQAESVPQMCACWGPPGVKGEPGLVGPKGDTGAKGDQGAKGSVGEKGSAGRNGHKGAPGAPGEPGPKGEKGEVGEKGASGTPGERGLPGVNGTPGERGLPGVNGTPGERGLPGVNGTPGERGLPGVNGTPGERGAPGVNGTPGEHGAPGVDGTPGERGLPGVDGTTGERGASGVNGTPGERGAPGVNGTPGERGASGVNGTPGERGAPGVDGTPGERGAPGVDGTPGERGAPGVDGTNGEKGGNGEKGEQGVIGPRGPSGLKGSRGATGGVGPKGQKGERGSTGATGYGQKGQKGVGQKGQQGERGYRGVTGYGQKGQKGVGQKGQKGQNGIKGNRGPPGPQEGGSVYTRWGRTSCPSVSGTTEVYDGYAAGSHWNTQGGGASVLCLPKDPQYYNTYHPGTQDSSRIAIAEYGAHQGSNAEYEIPCAVCMTTRLTLLMIPAKYSCPSGWTREYYGHLGSSRKNNYRVEYICVDYFAQRRGSNSNDATVLDIVRVEVSCDHSMPCPPYNSYQEVSCVVCSK